MDFDPYLKSLLGKNERILLICRQHYFVFIANIVAESAWIVAIILLIFAARFLLPSNPITPWLPYGFFLTIIPLISLLHDFFQWLNRKYILTDFRVIQIAGIFNKNVIDSSLEKVNDVKLSQSFLGRIFNYGTIEILTASELGVNKISRLGDPIHFKTTMINAKEALGHADEGYRSGAGPTGTSDVPTMIAELDNLRQQGLLTPEEFQAKKAELLKRM